MPDVPIIRGLRLLTKPLSSSLRSGIWVSYQMPSRPVLTKHDVTKTGRKPLDDGNQDDWESVPIILNLWFAESVGAVSGVWAILVTFHWQINILNKVFLLNLVRKLWRTDKSNTFLRVMPPVRLLPQTLPVTSVWPGDRTHDICAATRAFYH